MTSIRHLLFFLSIILTALLQAQTSKSYDSLSSYLKQSVENFEVPGMAVGIIKDGEVVFSQGFGFRNTETKAPVDTETIFAIASCSKAFTAASIGILTDEGLINWNDKVIDHYPGFLLNEKSATAELLVVDLLCHRSGLQTFDGDLLWYGSNYSRQEVVDRIRYRPLSYPVRHQFGYQNVMYIAAGELINYKTHQTWDEFLTEKIFSPLNMSHTSTSNSAFDLEMDNVAWPHIDGKPITFLNYDNCGPAASINSNLVDLLKWLNLFLNKGKVGETTIFSEKTYHKLLRPHSNLNAGNAETINGTHFYSYALGWFVFDYNGRKIIQHGGGLPGFHSKVVLIPEENTAFVVLANEISGLVEATYKKILDFELGIDSVDWSQIYFDNQLKREERQKNKVKEKEEKRVLNSKPQLELVAYEGTYEDKMYGAAKIELTENQLQLSLLPSNQLFTASLSHWHYDTFSFQFNDPFLPVGYISFQLNSNGEVKGFNIDLENPDFHFYKLDFQKIDN